MRRLSACFFPVPSSPSVSLSPCFFYQYFPLLIWFLSQFQYLLLLIRFLSQFQYLPLFSALLLPVTPFDFQDVQADSASHYNDRLPDSVQNIGSFSINCIRQPEDTVDASYRIYPRYHSNCSPCSQFFFSVYYHVRL